ncbi:hypothetical protein GOP47_0000252 [Adiantum capillus-veneris]|uniref:Uncharacterized protein n=1 Tax=Adiantum capillus-veneris TaxID=13818 RepID=A0A9D4ZQJ5_ADICA|nr:hypothetical protein GOP47_0000252 [Adiantum capillus-veneris]
MNQRGRSDNAQRAAGSFNNHEFDFGLGSAFARSSTSGSLNAQRHQNASAKNTYGGAGGGEGGASQKPSSSSSSSWTWSSSSAPSSSSASSTSSVPRSSQSSSASGALHAPSRSMVGDITGKTWGAMDNISRGTTGKSGLVSGLSRGASPDLFVDLLGSSRSYTPSSNSKPQQQALHAPKGSTFSNLEAMAASLPKGVPLKDMKVSRPYQTDEMGDFISADRVKKTNTEDEGWAAFESLSSSKPSSGSSDPAKVPQWPSPYSSGGDPFGDFEGIPSAKVSSFPATNTTADPFTASSYVAKSSSTSSDDFFNFASAAPAKAPAPKRADTSSFSNSIDVDPFAFLGSSKLSASQPINTQDVESDPFESVLGKVASASSQVKQVDPVLETLWGSTKSQPGLATQSVSDDWGVETNFGASDHTETTTELDGLPPPPPGVSGGLSKEKGLEYYKQGQFADAIKWLSWAEILLHQNGEASQIIEVLTCRSSCLKEAGEYKKAVADCSKVIELDNGNTAILLQRALLYESMEKYKLGIADLKEVLKREPQNRVANNTLARLKKMGD